ncbi:MAG: peptidoglycan-N-acetylglucosamine deacetylase [Actinomycetota bacterium]|nr:peptidoglycan-N-acetylglucosamine deacetylase [Actinomycetota bacterium]
MVYEWGMSSVTSRLASARQAVLVRQHHLGAFEDPAPRPAFPADPVMRWGRWGLLPVSSLMRVQTSDPVVAITYDDGPDPEQTPAILDVLAERGVPATFFVLSDRAETYPAIIERMVREGHEVALHGIDHSRLTEVPGVEAVRRLREAKLRVEDVSGRPVRFYRPTYGAVGISTFAAARALGMEVVIWSAWAMDWLNAPVEEVAARGAGALHPGAILLLHDTTDDPAAAEAGTLPTFSRAELVRRILDGADAAGFRFLRVDNLVRLYPAVRSVTVQRPRPHLPFH